MKPTSRTRSASACARGAGPRWARTCPPGWRHGWTAAASMSSWPTSSATPLRHGGPPVTVTARIQSGGQGGGQLAVEVRDHGHGLPPAAIPHLFDRFYKADTARARSEGSGLGLAIAWENARLHGGQIHAGNHPDGGAVFTVSLP